jgi:hypothetical protein
MEDQVREALVTHLLMTLLVGLAAWVLCRAINRGKPSDVRQYGLIVPWFAVGGYFLGGCFVLLKVAQGHRLIPGHIGAYAWMGLFVGVINGNLMALLLRAMLWAPPDPDVPPRELYDPEG